ncbi:hypothetical protein GLOTRDRAFT_113740 [Gloeophyllum trabeum ATCC 11539]|uniref:Uncharacterized protein n=1 Tax=Gloeophyllum trabeum (strain ATCC 11539 / FP-39264 / Madison 617) TaxID=670483 RepID=S7QI28_GLOTA|nr:uncharacterized protein GLOTRDRAFT_113740 [Gloeophyllum trabeum ATCC 11539]EPQ58847.1 hypothetical protein GLOTRDRAFT_113740 [Gloeophyllum trabeum ATCC 11539]
MMWGWYYEEDLPSAAHGTRAKLLWPWDCLLMPLFRLRLEFPNVLQSIREPVLEAACLSFFSSRYTPSRLSWEAQDQIENLRRHILINKTAIERDYEAARPDPVYKLMLQIISPLFECLGMFYRERCLPRYPVARQFQRAIPHARLTELCTRVTEMLAGVRDYHDFVTVKPILEAISPRWDTRCVLEFRPRIQSLNWKESFRVNLDPDDSRYRLRCSGVAAYISTVLEKPEVEVRRSVQGRYDLIDMSLP